MVTYHGYGGYEMVMSLSTGYEWSLMVTYHISQAATNEQRASQLLEQRTTYPTYRSAFGDPDRWSSLRCFPRGVHT